MAEQRRLSISSLLLTFLAVLSLAFGAFGAVQNPGAKAAPKEEAIFPHMDKALGLLKAADGQLENAEPIFHGHRVAAIAHVKKAIDDLQKGIDDYMAHHPTAIRNEAIPAPPPSEAGDKYPHMQGALKLLQQAEGQLNEAARVYAGRRAEGLAETRAAIAEIQTGIRDATQYHP